MTSNDGITGPPDGRLVPRYAGPDTFARLPRLQDLGGRAADVAVLGIPFDAGVSYRPGARFGPLSRAQTPPRCSAPTTRTWTPTRTACSRWPTRATSRPTRSTSPRPSAPSSRPPGTCSSQAGRLVAVGGDHTVALPLLLRPPRPSTDRSPWSTFDAHLDTWDTYFGAPYTHRHPVPPGGRGGPARAGRQRATVGIRNPLYARTDLTEDKALGFAIVSTADVARSAAWTRRSTGSGHGSASARST